MVTQDVAEERVFPGPIRQVAHVVDDLHASLGEWLRVGVGPWLLMPELTMDGCHYRGRPTAPRVSIGFANSGDLQVELIQQHDDAPSIYREFLDSGRRGFHHVAFWTEDFDRTVAASEAEGWPVVHGGSSGGVVNFAYVDAGGMVSPVIEIMELNATTRWMAETVRRAAEEWDGSEPVRSLF